MSSIERDSSYVGMTIRIVILSVAKRSRRISNRNKFHLTSRERDFTLRYATGDKPPFATPDSYRELMTSLLRRGERRNDKACCHPEWNIVERRIYYEFQRISLNFPRTRFHPSLRYGWQVSLRCTTGDKPPFTLFRVINFFAAADPIVGSE